MRLRRRDFLQAIVVTAAAVPFSGCGSDDDGGGSTAADPDAAGAHVDIAGVRFELA